MSKKDDALKLALEAHLALREWINAVPHDTPLPAMPGIDGDWLDEVDSTIREALAEQGCDYCNHPQYAGTKCKNCGREQPAQQQEPVLWQILNGVCHAGVRSTENLAREAAAGMQKTHDLAGSLAAFHVRPLYTSPQPKPWVGLTTADLDEIDAPIRERGHATIAEIYRAIEAKLREKNA